LWVIVRERKRKCVALTFSLLSCERWYARGRQNMQLFEPHVLSPVLQEMVHKRRGEHAALRAAHSLSCVVGEGT